jgi:hypothetical protein
MQTRVQWLGVALLCCAACESRDTSSEWSNGTIASGGEDLAHPHAQALDEDHHHDDDHDHDHEGAHGDDHDHDHEHEHHHHAHVVLTPEIRRAAARILVLQSTHTDRTTEVVGVVDVHAESGDQDEALDELRAVTLAMGADAVLGVEFHHGETHDAPTHLSGLAVRFLSGIPYPGDR